MKLYMAALDASLQSRCCTRDVLTQCSGILAVPARSACPTAPLYLQSHLERHGHTMLPSGDNLPVIFVKLATKIESAFMLLLSDQLA